MNAKLVRMISERSKMLDEEQASSDETFLIKNVYPMILRQAYKGLTQYMLFQYLSENMIKLLKKQGYVVRVERDLQSSNIVTIEWGMQLLRDDGEKVKFVSPEEYNKYWDNYRKSISSNI